MGKKADKKVKSDRVNALRKQYDAFLEEDKKRKERNEYILGRLNNMRYNATAVHIRHKPIEYGDILPVYNCGTSRSERLERGDIQFAHPPQKNQNLQLDIHQNYSEKTSLLKEISKNYILIPKLRPSLVNNYVGTIPPQSLPPPALSSSPQMNTTSNEDWKIKYNILEQLKEKEKEDQITNYGKEENFAVKESQVLSRDDNQKAINSYNLQNYDNKEYNTKYEHEVPEKDLSFDKTRVESEPLNVKKSKISNSKDQELSTDHEPKSSVTTNNINPDVNTDYDYTVQSDGLEHKTPIEETVLNTSNIEDHIQQNNYPEETLIASKNNTKEINVYNDGEHQLNENIHQEEYPVQYEQSVEVEEKYPDSVNVYLDKDDYSPIQVLNPSELVEEKKPPGKEINTPKDDEINQYPVDMISVQDFTPDDDVKLIDGVNINPNYLATEQNIDPSFENIDSVTNNQHYTEEPQDSSGIEAFDTEQRETLYSENTQEFAHDQQKSGDVYNQEYTQDTTEAQEHPYYESPAALQEQEYPAEINEHEESSMRYDQNYEQQYATDYENQEYQGQEPQQYDQPEGYDQQQYQDYEYQEQDQETVQNVEQVLDNEQGYVNEQNVEANKEDPITPSQ